MSWPACLAAIGGIPIALRFSLTPFCSSMFAYFLLSSIVMVFREVNTLSHDLVLVAFARLYPSIGNSEDSTNGLPTGRSHDLPLFMGEQTYHAFGANKLCFIFLYRALTVLSSIFFSLSF